MLSKIIRLSLGNRALVLILSVLLMAAGLYRSFQAEVDVFPDLNAPTVVVMTEASGMAAEEVERLVTFPVETAVNGATSVRRVRSTSSQGFSVVWVEFDWGMDVYLARQIVAEKISSLSDQLPQGVSSPVLGPQSSILGEMLIIGLRGEETSMTDLRTIADWEIRPRLLSISGVSNVSVLGGEEKQFQIQLSPGKMSHLGVSMDEVIEATESMNENLSLGTINAFGNEYIVRGMSSTNKIEDIASTLVKKTPTAAITLGDIATITTSGRQPKMGTASEQAQPAVLMTVTKQPNTDTSTLTKDILNALDELREGLPDDVTVSTDSYRQQRFIDSSIGNVKESLLEGGIFVIIILFLFLANARASLISLVSMPLSLLITILTLDAMGLTLNTMSLGGMAIAIGSLVDDAIVDVENVWRRMRENRLKPPSERMSVKDVVFEASHEVRMPILNSTLIIAVCFFPLFLLSGMEGRMLIPLGIAFLIALLSSTLVALTLTPVLCSYALEGKSKGGKINEPGFILRIKSGYQKVLQWALDHKKGFIITCIALFICSLCGILALGSSFLPSFNEGSFTVNVSLLPGVSLEESDRVGKQAEELLLSVDEIQTVVRKTGRAELDEHALGVNVSEIEAPFVLNHRSRAEVTEEVREKLSTIIGANIEIGQPITHRIDAMLSGTESSIAVKIFGEDLQMLHKIGTTIKEEISEHVQGLADVNVEQQVERPELQIKPRRQMLDAYGISMSHFNEDLETALMGKTVSEVYEGGKRFDLVLILDAESRKDMETVKDVLLDTSDGRKVPLYEVADIISTSGPAGINRENVQRKVVVSANLSGKDLGSAVKEIQETIDEVITLPKGYHIEYGGQFESQQKASRTLYGASILSILVIFLLLEMQLKGAKESLVVLLNLPLALIGGVIVLLLTSREISIPAIIGFISLFGIATRGGMLLISRYQTLEKTKNDCTLRQRIIQGSMDRLSPILMTALTSFLALIPLALQGSLPGNEIQSPMAKVILGGLFTSTLLNVLIIPIVYEWMQGKKSVNAIQAEPETRTVEP